MSLDLENNTSFDHLSNAQDAVFQDTMTASLSRQHQQSTKTDQHLQVQTSPFASFGAAEGIITVTASRDNGNVCLPNAYCYDVADVNKRREEDQLSCQSSFVEKTLTPQKFRIGPCQESPTTTNDDVQQTEQSRASDDNEVIASSPQEKGGQVDETAPTQQQEEDKDNMEKSNRENVITVLF